MIVTEYRRLPNGVWQLLDEESGSWVNERSIPTSERPWRPFLQEQPYRPDGTPGELADGETFWANSHYLVHRRVIFDDNDAQGVHLSLRTVENDTRHDWRDLQRIKNELCGAEWEAVELYPAVSRVVDTANQYHLWCLSRPYPIGFPGRLVMDTEESTQLAGVAQRPLNGAHDEDLYDIAHRVTDEVLGPGTYAEINAGNPDPAVQRSIRRATRQGFPFEIVSYDRTARTLNVRNCDTGRVETLTCMGDEIFDAIENGWPPNASTS